jgi:hypothetical protein
VDKRTFGEELSGSLVGKAVIWGPTVAGALIAGPAGALVGAVIGLTTFLSGCSGSVPPPQGKPPKE